MEKVSISKWSVPTEHWIATEYFVFCSSTVVYERQLYYSLIFIEHAIALLILCQKKGSCMLEGKKDTSGEPFFITETPLSFSLSYTLFCPLLSLLCFKAFWFYHGGFHKCIIFMDKLSKFEKFITDLLYFQQEAANQRISKQSKLICFLVAPKCALHLL